MKGFLVLVFMEINLKPVNEKSEHLLYNFHIRCFADDRYEYIIYSPGLLFAYHQLVMCMMVQTGKEEGFLFPSC